MIPQFREPFRLPELRPQVLDLWNRGKDTAEIASILGIREFQAYNTLASVDGAGVRQVMRLRRVPA